MSVRVGVGRAWAQPARRRRAPGAGQERKVALKGPGLLFVVSGPSGAGKDTVVEALRERMPRLRYSVSATTRAPRPGELEGESYFFTDRTAFEERMKRGEFLETREYNANLYGTPRSFVEQRLLEGYDVIMKPEVNGALAIKSAFPAAVLIFLLPDRFSYLQRRLDERRTETSEEIAARLAIAHQEYSAIPAFDYVLINEQAPPEKLGQLPAVDDLEAILHAERFRIHHYSNDDFRKLRES
ncbi:MAG: guanylate kinase [Candidatus Eremiobacteraeota bacterium]|nr:guanylate kinase [Candidatus Eremiobacteraeota bacterium]